MWKPRFPREAFLLKELSKYKSKQRNTLVKGNPTVLSANKEQKSQSTALLAFFLETHMLVQEDAFSNVDSKLAKATSLDKHELDEERKEAAEIISFLYLSS